MGKIQSKHGSYDALKKEKQLSKVSENRHSLFICKLPESKVYGDIKRRNSFNGSERKKRNSAQNIKRPHTIISTELDHEYERFSTTLETINIQTDSLDDQLYYSFGYNDTSSNDEQRNSGEGKRISILNTEPTLATLIEETKQCKRPLYLNYNHQKIVLDSRSPTEEREPNEIFENATKTEAPRSIFKEIFAPSDDDMDLADNSIISTDSVIDAPRAFKVEENYESDYWDPQVLNKTNTEDNDETENNLFMNVEEEEGAFIVHHNTHKERTYSELESDDESNDSFKSCESDPEELYKMNVKIHFDSEGDNTDFALSTIEEESEGEKSPGHIQKNKNFFSSNISNNSFNENEEIEFINSSAGKRYAYLMMLQNCNDFILKEVEFCTDDHRHKIIEIKNEELINKLVETDAVSNNDEFTFQNADNVSQGGLIAANKIADKAEQARLEYFKILLEICGDFVVYERLNCSDDHTIKDKSLNSSSKTAEEEEYFVLLKDLCTDFIICERIECSDDHSNRYITTNINDNNKKELTANDGNVRNEYLTLLYEICTEFIDFERVACTDDHYDLRHVDVAQEYNKEAIVEQINQENYLQSLQNICNEFIMHEIYVCSDDHKEIQIESNFDKEERNQDDEEYLKLLSEIITDFIYCERIACSDDHNKILIFDEKTINKVEVNENNECNKNKYTNASLEYLKLLGKICTDFINDEKIFCSDEHEIKLKKKSENKVKKDSTKTINKVEVNENNECNNDKYTKASLEYLKLLAKICTDFINDERIFCSDEHGIKSKKNSKNEVKEDVDNENDSDLDYLRLISELCSEFIDYERFLCTDNHSYKFPQKSATKIHDSEDKIIEYSIVDNNVQVTINSIDVNKNTKDVNHKKKTKSKNDSMALTKLENDELMYKCEKFLFNEQQQAMIFKDIVSDKKHATENLEYLCKEFIVNERKNALPCIDEKILKNICEQFLCQEKHNSYIYKKITTNENNSANNIDLTDLCNGFLFNEREEKYIEQPKIVKSINVCNQKPPTDQKANLIRTKRKKFLKNNLLMIDFCEKFLTWERYVSLIYKQLNDDDQQHKSQSNIKLENKKKENVNVKNDLSKTEIDKLDDNQQHKIKTNVKFGNKKNEIVNLKNDLSETKTNKLDQQHKTKITNIMLENKKNKNNLSQTKIEEHNYHEYLKDVSAKFLLNERNDVFKVIKTTIIQDIDINSYKKVYSEKGQFIDDVEETKSDVDISEIQEQVELSKEFETVQRIRESVAQIREEMEGRNKQPKTSFMVALLQEMRKLNAVFCEDFDPALLNLQQTALLEIQKCMEIAKSQ